MSERAAPSRQRWMPSALPLLFGEEPESLDPWPRLLDVVSKSSALSAEIREEAAHGADELVGVVEGLLSVHSDSNLPPRLRVEDLESPMRVVLMGRTMAGKSSLLTALTGSHHERIGDGRQRFSRDVFGAASSVSPHIEVVDTPGVGAHGGADDTELALKAALDADVILWVNSSDSIQQESAAALRLLGVIGKPIVVVINCRQSLDGVGRLNLLRFPERVFGNREGLLDEIRRHMAEAGVKPLEVVYVHALAATEALARADVDAELHAASRIDAVINALVRERDAHGESRRALRLIDGQRQEAEALALSLQAGAATFRDKAERDSDTANDIHARVERVARSAGEAMEADVEAAVGRRRDWHLDLTDFGVSLQSDWTEAVTDLHDELRRTLGVRLANLAEEVRSTIEGTAAEWSNVSHEQFTLRDLAGFNAVWGNRLIRAGVGVGSALAVLGVATLIGGPIGFVVAAVGGPTAAVVATPLKNFADRLFLGKVGVLRKRREEVAKQVGPILDDLTQEYRKAIHAQVEAVRDGIVRERARIDAQATSLENLSSQWDHHARSLRALVRELDRETASALLRIHGRERLARSVRRATRVPGVCIFAELDDGSFWESWLFPPDLGETFAGGKRAPSGSESASALSYTLSLVDAPGQLVKADNASAVLRMDADIPLAITQTWAGGLEAHLGRRIEIETTRRIECS